MVASLSGIIAIALYLSGTLYLVAVSRQSRPAHRFLLLLTAILALIAHGTSAWHQIYVDGGFHFRLWPVTVCIFAAVNLIVFLSSLRRPVHSLFVILFPLAALVLGGSLLLGTGPSPSTKISLPLGSHILFSLLAYSLFTIAAGQALLLAYQDRQLKHHQPGGFLKNLPALQTMEQLLFEVIWSGFLLLTLALISGFLFVEDFMAQHLIHKTVFSTAAWLIYAVLLSGRHWMGWRGHTAIRWTLGGFVALALAYWGSKFVLEVILGIP